MKSILVCVIALFGSVQALAQSSSEILARASIQGCGLPQNAQFDYPALKAKVDADAASRCQLQSATKAVRITGITYSKPKVSGWGPTECSPTLTVEAYASYTCLSGNEQTPDAADKACLRQCNRTCLEAPVFCGSW